MDKISVEDILMLYLHSELSELSKMRPGVANTFQTNNYILTRCEEIVKEARVIRKACNLYNIENQDLDEDED